MIMLSQDVTGCLQSEHRVIVILAQMAQQQDLQTITGALFNHLGAFGVFQVAVVSTYARFEVVGVEGIVLEQVSVVVAFKKYHVEIAQRALESGKTVAEISENANPVAAIVHNKGAGIYSIVGGGDCMDGDMAHGDAVAGDEILELGWADFAQPVSHNLVGIARAEDWTLKFALKNPCAGCMVGVIVGNEQAIETFCNHAITRHAFLGTLKGDACIKDEPDIS